MEENKKEGKYARVVKPISPYRISHWRAVLLEWLEATYPGEVETEEREYRRDGTGHVFDVDSYQGDHCHTKITVLRGPKGRDLKLSFHVYATYNPNIVFQAKELLCQQWDGEWYPMLKAKVDALSPDSE